MSGLDPFALARRKPLATAEEWAAMEFEPWTKADVDAVLVSLSNPRFNNDVLQVGIDLRISAGAIGRTKAELVAGVADVGEEWLTIIERLQETVDWLKEMANLAGAAHARFLCAAHCVWAEEPEKD